MKLPNWLDRRLWTLRFTWSDWRLWALKMWDVFLARVWDRRRKATLTFYFPDDKWNFECAIKGVDYNLATGEFAQYLRGYRKHMDPEKWPNLEQIEDEFLSIFRDRDLEVY